MIIFFYIFLPAFNIDKKLEIDDNQTKSAPTVITLANEILDIIKEDDILLLVGTKYDARYVYRKKNHKIICRAVHRRRHPLGKRGRICQKVPLLRKPI